MVIIYKYLENGEKSENGELEDVKYNYETELGKKGSELLNELEKNSIKREDEYVAYLTNDGYEKVKEFFKKNILNLLQDFLKTIYGKNEDFDYYIEFDYHNTEHLTLCLQGENERDYYNVCEICHEIIIR